MSEGNEESQNKKKSTTGVWIIITILALIGAGILGWMYSKESSSYEKCKTANAHLEKEMGAMNDALGGYIDTETKDLKKDFQSMLDTYDKLKEMDASKADSLSAQQDSIRKLLDELNDTKNRSYYQIGKLKKRNSRLRDIMDRYLVTIDSLHNLNTDLNSKLTKTSSELDKTEKERNELKEENEKNANLLNKGAKLNAFNFVSQALRYRLINGNTHDVSRANRAEVISSTFTISANKIASTGNKTIYLQIIDPDGQVMYNRPNDVTKVAGSEILYSGKRDINYQGQQIDMTIVYNLEEQEIPSGNYKVKVFADGALVGKDTFTLR